jgi:hypothetical protein
MYTADSVRGISAEGPAVGGAYLRCSALRVLPGRRVPSRVLVLRGNAVGLAVGCVPTPILLDGGDGCEGAGRRQRGCGASGDHGDNRETTSHVRSLLLVVDDFGRPYKQSRERSRTLLSPRKARSSPRVKQTPQPNLLLRNWCADASPGKFSQSRPRTRQRQLFVGRRDVGRVYDEHGVDELLGAPRRPRSAPGLNAGTTRSARSSNAAPPIGSASAATSSARRVWTAASDGSLSVEAQRAFTDLA